jgi:hypothetical protein
MGSHNALGNGKVTLSDRWRALKFAWMDQTLLKPTVRFYDRLADLIHNEAKERLEADLVLNVKSIGFAVIHQLANKESKAGEQLYHDFIATSNLCLEDMSRERFYKLMRSWWKVYGTTWFASYQETGDDE